jgi:PadR family transcriptional regulator PadR
VGKSRNYLKGVIEILILSILRTEDCYGYQLTSIIKEHSGGLLSIPLGTLYPSLYRLEETGHVGVIQRMVGKRLRSYYHLTPSGLEYFQTIQKEYSDVVTGVNNILSSMEKRE